VTLAAPAGTCAITGGPPWPAFFSLYRALSNALILCALLCAIIPARAQARPPAGWGDFRFGLVSDGKGIFNERMSAAVKAGIRLDYRYAYVNTGANPATNGMSWLFGDWGSDFIKDGEAIGVRAAFVVYMLQEDGGVWSLSEHAKDTAFLRMYFTTLRLLGERSQGHHAIFVVEPDTWGYIMQAGIDPREPGTTVLSAIVPDYPFLAGLPDSYSGLAQAIIRTLKHYAPDGYAGALMSHWSADTYACPAEDTPNSYMGVAWASAGDIDCSADRTVEFAKALLGDGPDRGDFIGIEKSGHSAGWWYQNLKGDEGYRRMYYWGDAENANFLRWCDRLGKGMEMPLLGWQISIGSMGMRNGCLPGPLADTVKFGLETGNCAFEDTFFPYFFSHTREFLDAGFIGFLAGKGLGDDTDFGPASEPEMADGGWFFDRMAEFDKGRPYLISKEEADGIRPIGPGGSRANRANMKRPPAFPFVIDAGSRWFDLRGRPFRPTPHSSP
jgi:hypothetical protein